MSGTVIRGWGRPATARATEAARGFALLCGVSLAGFCLVAPLAAQTESPDDAARAPAIIAVPAVPPPPAWSMRAPCATTRRRSRRRG